jgi:hypothetical protein
MNGCRSIIAFGPVRIRKTTGELAADLLQRRATIAAVLTKYVRAGDRGMSETERELLSDARYAREQQNLPPLPSSGTQCKPALIAETIRAMSLTDDQIPNLIDNFQKFWKAPDGLHVASRRTLEFWRLDRVLTSGLAAAANIQ